MAKSKSFALILGVLIMSFLVGYLIFAQVWQEPTAPPPQANVPAPINVGTTAQTKQATLTINPGELQAQLFRDVDAGCGQAGGSWYINPSGISVLCGNVGIGTTSPTQKLDVRGFIATDVVNSYSSGDPLELQYNIAGDVKIHGTDSNLLVEGTGNSYFAGKVGIGTTNPGYKLDVAGQIRATVGTAVYIRNQYCEQDNLFTQATTCQTRVCNAPCFPACYYFRCDGTCPSIISPQTCSNTLVGRLLAP